MEEITDIMGRPVRGTEGLLEHILEMLDSVRGHLASQAEWLDRNLRAERILRRFDDRLRKQRAGHSFLGLPREHWTTAFEPMLRDIEAAVEMLLTQLHGDGAGTGADGVLSEEVRAGLERVDAQGPDRGERDRTAPGERLGGNRLAPGAEEPEGGG